MSTHSTFDRSPLTSRPIDARTATERADRRIGKAIAGVAASGMVVSFACAILLAFGAIH